ncbi:Autophagy-related protein [Wickerhamomyces ciferrii]|uniref:Autophagy-related protein 11 n=1 Tax=Wickerhamomyces ciferrii (strain ATCC 14091 / BCRC 22168 / CBS 111 / JCM 3599 / NBRC 0793 / NRRL Y-1031 F-60-10) TaxID=1206466 RepID=K0KWW1_WICCF|nr:Autophagy-related protein [Wickerhamomyces ciferrii]CCH45974.1 Autophagy-related protein [Wickerhamomyces ciferrii]
MEMSESIQVINAHTGESVGINRYYYVTLDELRKFCSNQFNIPSNQLFLISPFGYKIKKTSSLEEINEIYVYDTNLFSNSNSNSQSSEFIKSYISSQFPEVFDNLIQPINSPLLDVDLNKISNAKNSRQMISLLTTNLGWVAAIQSDTLLFHKRIIELSDRIRILFKALRVATQYIDSFYHEIKKNYDSTFDFVISLQQQSLNLSWKDHYKKLKYISLVSDDQTALSTLVNQRELDNQAHQSIKETNNVTNELLGFKNNIENSKNIRLNSEKELDTIETETLRLITHFESIDELKDLNLLADKVQSDTKHLLSKNKSTLDDIDVEIILETFQTHKSEFVEKIYNSSLNIFKIFGNLKSLFLKLQIDLTKQLQILTTAQTDLISVKESLKNMSKKIETIQSLESSLSQTADLPLLYGLYIVEDIRRSEWLQEMKSLASKTIENFASIREREVKYRTQWVKNFGSILKLLNYNISSFNSGNIATFDLNINEDSSIKTLGSFIKEDVLNYIDQLKNIGYNPDNINVITRALNDLPLRRSRIKLSDSGGLDNTPSDQAIKGYKARIKKLESLLHQEQFKNFNQWPSQTNDSRLSALSRYSLVFDKSQNKSQFRPNSGTIEPHHIPGSSKVVSPSIERSVSPPSVNSHSAELITARSENEDLKKKIQKMKDTIEATNQELKSVRDEFSSHYSESQGLIKQLETLKDQHSVELSSLKTQIDDLENKSFESKRLTTKQKNDISKLEELLNERNTFIDELKQTNYEKIEELETKLNDALNKKSDSYYDLESDFEKFKTEHYEQIKSLESQVNLKSSDQSESHKELEEAYEKLQTEYNTKIKDLEDQLHSIKEDKHTSVEDLENQFEKLETDHDFKISTLKTEHEEEIKHHKSLLEKKGEELSQKQIPDVSEELKRLKQELETQKAENNKLQEALNSKDKEIEDSRSENEEQKVVIADLKRETIEIKNLTEQKDQLVLTNLDLNKEIDKFKNDYTSLASMKNDLLENMSNRENEFAREKKSHQGEIESLKMKLEELEKLQDEYEAKQSSIINDRQTILQLVIIINSLIIKAKDLSEIVYNDYGSFCATLRSMGLLAVRNDNGEVNIIRVKGLRKLGETTDFSTTLDRTTNGMKSDLEQEAFKFLSWVELPDLKSIQDLNLENEEESSFESLDLVVDNIIENYNLDKFEDKYLTFVNHITNLSPLYKSSISKRFKEVENLAKRELKENKRFKELQSTKISIRDFKVDDLVLFLPTRSTLNNANGQSQTNNAWAAFNDTGDMKYLLKNDLKIQPSRQWIIAKILQIEQAENDKNEYQITAEEVIL